MGVHIIVYKLGETIVTENWSFQDETYTEMDRYEKWDTLRQSGDKEFASSDLCAPVLHEDGRDYYRVKDYIEAREWVEKNVPANRKRWYDILKDMEGDGSLVFCFAW